MKLGKNKVVVGIVVVVGIIFLIYIISKVYNAAVEDATARIRVGVEEGARSGVSKGAGDIVNPLKIPGRIFGR